MKKHRYIAILVPLLGLAACGVAKKNDELRTPELFAKKAAESFIYKSYGEKCQDAWWYVATTTEDLQNKDFHADYNGKIHSQLYRITSYEEKDNITEDDKYIIYKKLPSNDSQEQSMTIYDNGYIEIKSGHGLYGGVNYFRYYIDPELAKSIHDSIDEQIRTYYTTLEEEEELANTFSDSSTRVSFMSENPGKMSLYDKEKQDYLNRYSIADNETLVDYLKEIDYSQPSNSPNDANGETTFKLEFTDRKRTLYCYLYDSFDLICFHYDRRDELGIKHENYIKYKISKDDGKKINDFLQNDYISHTNK